MVGFNKERAEKCRCTEKTRGGEWIGKADRERERDLKGGKERKGPRGRRSHLRARKRFPLSMEV